MPGGTSATFDWSLLPADFAAAADPLGRAGPDNITAAVRAVRPAAVDTSSGVEANKGIRTLPAWRHLSQEFTMHPYDLPDAQGHFGRYGGRMSPKP